MHSKEVASLIGMKEADAVVEAHASGFRVRVIKRDDQSFIVTSDFRKDRINLSVRDGLVTEARIG